MAAALDHFSDRLIAGARTDLLALAKLPFIKSRTAWVESMPSCVVANLEQPSLLGERISKYSDYR